MERIESSQREQKRPRGAEAGAAAPLSPRASEARGAGGSEVVLVLRENFPHLRGALVEPPETLGREVCGLDLTPQEPNTLPAEAGRLAGALRALGGAGRGRARPRFQVVEAAHRPGARLEGAGLGVGRQAEAGHLLEQGGDRVAPAVVDA